MKHKHYRIVVIALVISCAFGFQAAEDPLFLKKLVESLKQYNAGYPEEKIYLQLDKPFYKPGDDIWFNAFVLNSNTHKPTNISDVLYVELIDAKGNVARRLDLVIREGTAHGDFALETSAPGGLYQVRAYTHWMKNFDNAFKKEIQVQRVHTPRFLLRLDYEKESYGAGDLVTAKLNIKNLKNEKVAHADVDVTVKIDGSPVFISQIQSDPKGDASIAFKLPDTLNTTDGLLQLIVRANGLEESISRSVPIVLNKIALQFFPEGGNWLHEVNSTVAFKALNEFGKGADVKGSIIDQEGRIVTAFESFHMGMGAFKMKPVHGSRYFARIESPRGNHTTVPLPDATTGFLLNLINRDDSSLRWAVHSPNNTYAYLVGHCHGEIVYTEKIKLAQGINHIPVSTTKFPAGIAVFTLFDGEGIEQCERLVFLNKNKGLSIALRTNKQRYLPGEKVKVDIKTTDGHGNPIPAKISLAVVDDQVISFADDKQDNMLSALLLSSEVKGEIQEPSFYFDPDEAKASEALDYLLLTQGWRRFSWQDVHKNNRVITYSPEKNRNIGGMLVNKQREGISGEVALVELGGKKRIAKVKTTRSGHFIFKNIDPTIPLLLLTKKPGEIAIKKELSFSISLNDREGTILVAQPLNADQLLTTVRSAADEQEQAATAEGDLDMSLSADVSQLSEVVITSFGVQEKRALASSIVTITRDVTEGLFNGAAPENALQGRIAGVMVQPQTGNAGSQVNLMVRGLSSLAGGRSEPLYVIDGHPIGTALNQNFSNGSSIGPDNIRSVEVVNSPEATALYGCAAANGAILITTRSGLGYDHFPTKKRKPRYSSLTITPRKFSPVREFYVPSRRSADAPREDFRTTVFWDHSIVTDARGNASVSFHNNDAISAFRMTAEGFSGSGLIGRKEEVYHTELPLSLDVKLPEFLGYEDVLKLPVRVKNETSSIRSAKITLTLPDQLAVKEQLTQEIEVKPKSTATTWFTITSNGVEGEFPISVKLSSEDHSDKIDHVIHVRSIGFPMRQSYSARELDRSFSVSIDDAEKNSVAAEFTAFPDVLSDLFTGAESILREPHGCFEQVSSSTFPNILALQFLKQSGLVKPEVEKQALSFIQNGYGRLVAYEIKGGGFEWFGHPPAHEGLTAYGLLEFHEMKKVYTGVDEKMMARTRDFLLSRRNGKGGFKQHAGKYGFSGAREEVTNAYIVYALSETGTKDIKAEYQQALAEANKSKDLYRMALVANAAFNMQEMNDYSGLITYFRETIAARGFSHLKADHSIVRSYGESLQNEIVSLWVMAMLKSPSPDVAFANVCIRHLLSKRANGQFGSTQGTALALQALTRYATFVRTVPDDGKIQIFVDNTLTDKFSYEKDTREKLVLQGFAKGLHGDQTIRVLFGETEEPLPYSIDIRWNTKKPQSSDLCKVALSTELSAASARLNETVRMTITLRNKTSEGLPMTTAVIGIPAGLSVQPWQLKELQEKAVFDFYEVIDGNLVVYYREMAPNGELKINVDLKAEIPGQFVARASSAYLYYANEFKNWVSGNSISVQ